MESTLWKHCSKCNTDNPEEMVFCVNCKEKLPPRGDKNLAWLELKEIPSNPSPADIDFDKDGRTYVVVFLIKMRQEWYRLSREERIKINRGHIKQVANYAKLVNRVMLRCEGLSKYDYVETIEADDLKIINSLMRTIKDSEKGRFIDIVEAIVTIKGLSLYSPQAVDCLPSKA